MDEATLADAARIAALLNEISRGHFGEADLEAERDRAWLDVRVLSGESRVGETLLRELERRAVPDTDPGRARHALRRSGRRDHAERRGRRRLCARPPLVPVCRLHASGDLEHGLVSVLAMRRAWRRRGLGSTLLQHSFEEMRRRGMRKVSLGVDGENTTGAVWLYERAGMTVERRWDCYRKAL